MRQVIVVLAVGLCCAYAAFAADPAGRDYHDQDLSSKSFAKASLNGASFSDATLKTAVFSGASLKKASFKGANVEGVNFDGADLSGADMRGTVGSARYWDTNLTDTNFEGVTFCPNFRCNCRGANFKKSIIGGNISGGDFNKVNFSGANLRRASGLERPDNILKGAIYDDDTAFPEGFDPKSAGMVPAKVADGVPAVAEAPKGKDYHDQDLSGKSFASGVLNGADFSDATLKTVVFSDASLKRASFKGANVAGANFGGADLTGADMRGTVGAARYWDTNLTDTNFEGVTFGPHFRCKCRGANFKKSVISGYISGGDFNKVNFSGANLRKASGLQQPDNSFKGAVYDDDTAFPEDFDPKAAGMVLAKADGADKK